MGSIKFFIYAESIDPSFYERLTDKGIPEADIFPVYLPDFEMGDLVVGGWLTPSVF